MSEQLKKVRARSKFRPLDKPGTATVYIGNDRYLKLLTEARNISNEINVDVKASDILRFIIDQYSGSAVKEFKVSLKKLLQEQEENARI
ncbi:hypothetical protein AGJ34_21230 [Cronobacter dublinensis subsp. dublinensis]|nr:hypothetical protein [Cronobacter dublinensis subsp. dublinensis]EGT5730049.1 hypothetical protein [Cronobacter dublinensis subsp. dublinensis]